MLSHGDMLLHVSKPNMYTFIYSLRQAVYLTLNICLIINECIHVGEGKDDSRKLVLTVKGKGKL